MQMTVLPNYTTERYYLLSEIEQRATFEYLIHEDENSEINKQSKPNTHQHDAFYLLWDMRACSAQTVAGFRQSTTKLLEGKHREAVSENRLISSLLAIETLVDKKEDGVTNNNIDVVRDHLQEIMDWIKENHRIGCVYMGVADNPAGSPALEAISDYATIIDNHYESLTGTGTLAANAAEGPRVRVIAVRDGHMLGHDPSRDPDAASNVYQAECIFTTNGRPDDNGIASSISTWLKSLGLATGVRNNGSNVPSKRSKKNKGANDEEEEEFGVGKIGWGTGDSIISLVIFSCAIAWALSYFLSLS